MKTGIDVLDSAGGIPENSNILLIGPPGPEKMLFGIKILSMALKTGRKGVYVTTDVLPSEIEKRSKAASMDLSEFTNKTLQFVDCYSWTLGEAKSEAKSLEGRKDISVPGPSALNDLSIGITQSLMDKEQANVIFQSISTLLLYNAPEIVFRFVQIMGSRLKFAGATTLLHCEAQMHDERTIVTLKHLTDHVIEIKQEGGKNFIMSPTLGVKTWAELIL
ncbi:MAG: RAD55 family ATPase [Candidatus Micrarchaeia archaeon]